MTESRRSQEGTGGTVSQEGLCRASPREGVQPRSSPCQCSLST